MMGESALAEAVPGPNRVPERIDTVLPARLPPWFARLDASRLPFPEVVGKIVCLGDLARLPSSAIGRLAATKVRTFVLDLLDVEEEKRRREDWPADCERRDPSVPAIRPIARRRQRPKPKHVTREPYAGPRIDNGPLVDRSGGKHWTDIQTEYLRMRWADGLTCRAIAFEMRASKNSVLARLYRLGLLATGEPLVDRRDEGKTKRAKPPRKDSPVVARPVKPRAEARPIVRASPKPVDQWTPDRLDRLKAMWSAGDGCPGIALAIGLTESETFRKLSELDLLRLRLVPRTREKAVAPPPEPPRPEPPTIERCLRPARHPAWSAEHLARLREARAAGISASEIGREIGRTKNAVIGKLDRLGLLNRRDG